MYTSFTDWGQGLCIQHYGVPKMHWNSRRYQYRDGSLTPLGREHYGVGKPRVRKRYQNEDGSLTSEGRTRYLKLESKKAFKALKKSARYNEYGRGRDREVLHKSRQYQEAMNNASTERQKLKNAINERDQKIKKNPHLESKTLNKKIMDADKAYELKAKSEVERILGKYLNKKIKFNHRKVKAGELMIHKMMIDHNYDEANKNVKNK